MVIKHNRDEQALVIHKSHTCDVLEATLQFSQIMPEFKISAMYLLLGCA